MGWSRAHHESVGTSPCPVHMAVKCGPCDEGLPGAGTLAWGVAMEANTSGAVGREAFELVFRVGSFFSWAHESFQFHHHETLSSCQSFFCYAPCHYFSCYSAAPNSSFSYQNAGSRITMTRGLCSSLVLQLSLWSHLFVLYDWGLPHDSEHLTTHSTV